MTHAKEINAFVHQSFDMYGLDFKQFFHDLVDEVEDDNGIPTGEHREELPLVIEEDIDMDLLAQAAKTLGVSTENLLTLDKDAVQCWYKKYPYFELREKFETARQHSFKSCTAQSVKVRLIELLKAYNAVMPGCYHENSEIMRLTIRTSSFIHFEQIEDLSESYLSLVSRARELFYRLWDTELSENEIKEYNFLVSVLGMRDVGYSPEKPIYYETARKFAPIYKKEGYSDYSSYIMYRGANFPAFYTCKEFYDYPELVEKLVREFTGMKAEIGKMAMLSKSFLCSFVWSDEPEPPIEASFDEYLTGTLHSFGEDALSWYRRVYVPKSGEELHGDEKYIAICERLSAPASRGGIKLSIPECRQGTDNGMKRIMARATGGGLHG